MHCIYASSIHAQYSVFFFFSIIQSGSVIHALRPIPYSIHVSILFIVHRPFSSPEPYQALTSTRFFYPTLFSLKFRFIVGTSRVKVQGFQELQKALNDARHRQFTDQEREEMKAPKKGRTNKEGQTWVLLSRKGYAASEISSSSSDGLSDGIWIGYH